MRSCLLLIELTQKLNVFKPNFCIILKLILIEHALIALKKAIAIVIPNLPRSVSEDEKRRQKIDNEVKKELIELKYDGEHETFKEMTERHQKKAAKVNKDKEEKQADASKIGSKKEKLVGEIAQARWKAMQSLMKKN